MDKTKNMRKFIGIFKNGCLEDLVVPQASIEWFTPEDFGYSGLEYELDYIEGNLVEVIDSGEAYYIFAENTDLDFLEVAMQVFKTLHDSKEYTIKNLVLLLVTYSIKLHIRKERAFGIKPNLVAEL